MSTKLIVTNYKNFKCGVKLNEGELVNIRFQPNEDVQIGDIYKVKITEILPNDSGMCVRILGNSSEEIRTTIYNIAKIVRCQVLA